MFPHMLFLRTVVFVAVHRAVCLASVAFHHVALGTVAAAIANALNVDISIFH
jgi:hypothetical protein